MGHDHEPAEGGRIARDLVGVAVEAEGQGPRAEDDRVAGIGRLLEADQDEHALTVALLRERGLGVVVGDHHELQAACARGPHHVLHRPRGVGGEGRVHVRSAAHAEGRAGRRGARHGRAATAGGSEEAECRRARAERAPGVHAGPS